jgi:hypothetical protein
MNSPLNSIALTVLLAGVTTPAIGAGLNVSDNPAADDSTTAGFGADWVPVDLERLESMRGGFQTASGLEMSFGIERVVYVNGDLLATTSVNIPDISRITADQAVELDKFNQGLLVQLGPGNQFTPSTNMPGGVVIQNTLNNQDIRVLTTLDVGVGTLGAFQNLNAQTALHDALILAANVP